jgi:type VI secretion system protein ImpH
MAAQSRGTDSDLKADLTQGGFRFDFFQAVRLLARVYPDRQQVGKTANPSKEVVRFRAHQSLAFPPSAIHQIRQARDERGPAEMTVAFMGLTGPQGVLPRYYSELMLERLHAKDQTLRDFFDLFNHRMISLFFRAWEKHRCAVGFEQGLLKGKEDRFAQTLFALAGLGTEGLRERLTIDDRSVLRYIGLLGQRPRSAAALERCLGDYFEVPVRVRQFVGAWLTLEEAEWTTIGVTGRNNLLGQSALAGTEIWDQQAAFKVELGPLEFEQFDRLLPSGQAYPTLVQLTKLFAGPELDFEVQLRLRADEVPPTRLRSTETYAPRLGWTTWLKTKPFDHHADDVKFSGSTMMAGAGAA